jgi:hypothetical protein
MYRYADIEKSSFLVKLKMIKLFKKNMLAALLLYHVI